MTHRSQWSQSRLKRFALSFCTAALLSAACPAGAQETGSVEEPDWSQHPSQSADDNSTGAVTLEEELAAPEEPAEPAPQPPPPQPEPAPKPALPPPPKSWPYSPPPNQGLSEAMLKSESPESDLGIPADHGWHLPDFANSADPFFQMEGLKIRVGEVHIRLGLTTSFSYDDNIFNSNDDRSGDYITRISPNFLVGAGDFKVQEENYLLLTYMPQPEFFAINTQQNTVNEFLTAAARYSFSRLGTSANFVYRKDSNPNADQIGRAENYEYNLKVDNSYAIGTKTFVELSLEGEYRDLSQSIDYTTTSARLAIAYQYSPKLRFSLGPLAGITFVDDGGTQPFQGISLTAQYDTFHKLTFDLDIGVQARQFEGPNPSGQSDYITPTFGLGVKYQLSSVATIALDLSRDVGNSGLVQGQTLITNSLALNYEQRLLSKFSFSLQLRYDILQYQGTGTNNRTDDFFVASPALNYNFWQDRFTVSLYYTRQQRASELQEREFYSNEFGTLLQCRF